jgi:hypothetical protein
MLLRPEAVMRQVNRFPTIELGLVFVLAACSGQTPATPPGSTATAVEASRVSTIAAATPLATPAPAATPAFPAPAELIGRWRLELGPGDVSILTIAETRYTIARLGIGQGRIAVRGDEIDFLKSNLCDGIGTYRWSIEGDALHLTPVGVDQCPGRADALWNKTYTRLS